MVVSLKVSDIDSKRMMLRVASYTLQEGARHLAADDNFEQFRDHAFNDLILRCRNLDPKSTRAFRSSKCRTSRSQMMSE
jgi:hypothetical protein